MRARLACAAILATAVPAALPAPDALASPAGPVEPGIYEIVNAKGHCLRGEGGFNSKALIGACDTRWKVPRSAERDSFVITHTTTANCLDRALDGRQWTLRRG
ncbi:hypothetical protein [Streptosporangium sp. NPDC001681]|uniref:hypothetical protein n=1 Tax=Streptosporangium sp. NPDC001681 TaxID=3154395 RepID=UPI0033220B53